MKKLKSEKFTGQVMEKKYMVGIAIFVIIAIALIIIVFGSFNAKKEYSFEEGFAKLQQIDQKYDTSFHNEQLNVSMPSVEIIPLIIEDIKEFEETLDESSSDVDTQGIFFFSDIRKLMLTSEWYFLQAAEIGEAGIVNDPGGFSCREAPEIIDATFYYNESFMYAAQAQSEIDDLLYMYKYHPDVWRLVGIDLNKTRFFKSDLKSVRHTIINNLESLKVYCGISGIKHQTTLTKIFYYNREIIPKEVFEK